MHLITPPWSLFHLKILHLDFQMVKFLSKNGPHMSKFKKKNDQTENAPIPLFFFFLSEYSPTKITDTSEHNYDLQLWWEHDLFNQTQLRT